MTPSQEHPLLVPRYSIYFKNIVFYPLWDCGFEDLSLPLRLSFATASMRFGHCPIYFAAYICPL